MGPGSSSWGDGYYTGGGGGGLLGTLIILAILAAVFLWYLWTNAAYQAQASARFYGAINVAAGIWGASSDANPLIQLAAWIMLLAGFILLMRLESKEWSTARHAYLAEEKKPSSSATEVLDQAASTTRAPERTVVFSTPEYRPPLRNESSTEKLDFTPLPASPDFAPPKDATTVRVRKSRQRKFLSNATRRETFTVEVPGRSSSYLVTALIPKRLEAEPPLGNVTFKILNLRSHQGFEFDLSNLAPLQIDFINEQIRRSLKRRQTESIQRSLIPRDHTLNE